MKNNPLIFGIVNVTPDSFSDGGKAFGAEAGLVHAAKLLADGADILDIGGESTRPGARLADFGVPVNQGGESTRPGARPVPAEEEIERVVPVIARLKREFPAAVISIDTRKAEVAKAATAAGAAIINDVSGLGFSPEMASVAAAAGAKLVIGHTRGTPEEMRRPENCVYGDVVLEVMTFWREAAAKAVAAGVPEENLIFDPCLGFAKTAEQDWELLRRLGELRKAGKILVAHSRKSFLGKLIGEPDPMRREAATLAVSLWAAEHGAAYLRVHDVKATRDALRVREALQG